METEEQHLHYLHMMRNLLFFLKIVNIQKIKTEFIFEGV